MEHKALTPNQWPGLLSYFMYYTGLLTDGMGDASTRKSVTTRSHCVHLLFPFISHIRCACTVDTPYVNMSLWLNLVDVT